MAEYQLHETDTGSPQAQIALMSARVRELTEHLREHPHDFASRRGLQQILGKRLRLAHYYANNDIEGYRELLKKLDIRDPRGNR